jgi:WXG100 family type VII secretion target
MGSTPINYTGGITMATVKMNYEGMEGAIQQVKKGIADQESVIKNIDSAVRTASGAWSGEAHKAFENKYREYRTTLTSFVQSLNEYATAMQKHMNDTRQGDMHGANMFK